MEFLDLLEPAASATEALLSKNPDDATLQSILAQLNYLGDIARGEASSSNRLGEIILGVQAAREIESIDPALAEMLYEIQGRVNGMIKLR